MGKGLVLGTSEPIDKNPFVFPMMSTPLIVIPVASGLGFKIDRAVRCVPP